MDVHTFDVYRTVRKGTMIQTKMTQIQETMKNLQMKRIQQEQGQVHLNDRN